MARILVVGSLNMDLVVQSPLIPRPGETIIGGQFATHPGGKGANQAVAAARAGADVSIVGRVGSDAFGDQLLVGLAEAGVGSKHVRRDIDTATGVALIVVEQSGQNSIVIAPGANSALTPADVEAAEDLIAESDLLLLQLEVPLDTVSRAAQLAQNHGTTVILNPAPACELPAALLSAVDVLIPNESEAELLTGLSVQTEEEAAFAARKLQQQGASVVIITLGSRGTLAADRSVLYRMPAFDVTPVDTTAAGDAFVGAFAVALAKSGALVDAIRWGSAAGALATTQAGAQPSLPSRARIADLLGQQSLEPYRLPR